MNHRSYDFVPEMIALLTANPFESAYWFVWIATGSVAVVLLVRAHWKLFRFYKLVGEPASKLGYQYFSAALQMSSLLNGEIWWFGECVKIPEHLIAHAKIVQRQMNLAAVAILGWIAFLLLLSLFVKEVIVQGL